MFEQPYRRLWLLALTLGLAGASAFAQDAAPPADVLATDNGGPNPAPRDPALKHVLADFGGKPGLVSLVDDLMINLMADPRTRPFFENADRAHIKAELVDQFCVILDGPCTYTGKDMAAAHRNQHIDRGQFNALVEDLQVAMDKHNIPFRSQNKLLAVLAPMYRQMEHR